MKRLMKKAFVVIMALTALLGVVACNTNTATEVNVVIGSAVTEIRAGDSVKLTATVTGADDTGVIWASENEKFLAVSADGVVSVVEAPSVDMTINVTATAKADNSKKVACTFYVKKKISQGEVGDLTAAMIEEIGNSAITVSGKITDIYKDLKTPSNSSSTVYDMTVKMEDGKWDGKT